MDHWLATPDGIQRTDGVCLRRSFDGWVILPPGEARQPLLHCPCCGAYLASEGQARAVADHYFPLTGI